MAFDAAAKPHQLIASDRIEGTAVRRPNGDMIGHIERLMIDKVSGQVSYAVMSSGGFLGMGVKLLPLPWGRLRYSPRFEAYELDLDEDELLQNALDRRLRGQSAQALDERARARIVRSLVAQGFNLGAILKKL